MRVLPLKANLSGGGGGVPPKEKGGLPFQNLN